MGKTRPALLFPSWQKQGDGFPCTWHCFGQNGDTKDGFGMIAIIEAIDGSVIEVDADRIKFTDKEQS